MSDYYRNNIMFNITYIYFFLKNKKNQMASELERVSDLLVEETRRRDAGGRELQDCQNLLADRLTQVEVVEQAYHVI